MSAKDVVLAVAHFSTQARESVGISQLVVVRALPFLVPYLAWIINSSLISGVFLRLWRESLLVALKKMAIPPAPTDSSQSTASFSLRRFRKDRLRPDIEIPRGQKDTES